MPKATVTVRELKNKDTGVDLSVTSYREIPGLVRSTFEFQIVVVTNLSCFKLPSHKDTDVVQFTLFKKFGDFEDLRGKLNETFSGTALPHLVKKSILVNETVIKERRNSLDSFLHFVSATPRIVTSSHVLSFLGVDEYKAKIFASGESDDTSTQGNEGGGDEEKEGGGAAMEKSASSLFADEEEEEEEGEDFLATAATGDDDDDFFSTVTSSKPSATSARLFESQDLKRELTEDDEKDFAFVPDAIITKKEVVPISAEDEENADLLNVEEDIDLDKLLTQEPGDKPSSSPPATAPQPPPPTAAATTEEEPSSPPPSSPVSPKPTPAAKPQVSPKPTVASKPTPTEKPSVPTKPTAPTTENKPVVPSKPTSPTTKPAVPSKPTSPTKPAVPSKPKPSSEPSGEPADKGGKPVVAAKPKPSPTKPAVAQKPKPAQRENAPEKSELEKTEKPEKKKDELGQDDIMKYIAANVEADDDDDDLFS